MARVAGRSSRRSTAYTTILAHAKTSDGGRNMISDLCCPASRQVQTSAAVWRARSAPRVITRRGSRKVLIRLHEREARARAAFLRAPTPSRAHKPTGTLRPTVRNTSVSANAIGRISMEGLQLRSLVKESGELELSLARVTVAEPKGDEVVIRVEATPINPSDIGLLTGPADMSTARASGTKESPVVTASIPPN